MKRADVIVARVLGAGCLILAGFELLLRHANQSAAAHGGHDLQSIWKMALFITVFGLCLIVYRRWSRILLLVLGAFSLSLCLERIYAGPLYGPRDSLTTNIFLLIIFSLPLLAAILFWRSSNS